MIRLLLKKWLIGRVAWSNTKYWSDINECKVTEKVDTDDFNKSLKQLLKKVYDNFTYKCDDYTELFDAMHKPAHCYSEYLKGDLQDDCDGFHAAIYHILKDFDCYIFTYLVNDITQCHTTLIIKYNKMYFHVDYTSVYSYGSLEQLINKIKANHPDMYAYNFVKYDYSKKKYYVVDCK